jgi:uncharacterized protein
VSLPRAPWVLAQTWEDTLFLHWPVEPGELRRAVPAQLPIETFEGRAWLTISPLAIRASHPRLVPPLYPWASFPEVNLRTYTTVGGRPGVYFISLECPSTVAVAAARAIFRLPYRLARIRRTDIGPRTVVRSTRLPPGPRPAGFAVDYAPARDLDRAEAAPDTLDRWLLERYSCYGVDRLLGVLRTEIQHPPWRVAPTEVTVHDLTLPRAHGLPLAGEPLVHSAADQHVLFWAPRRARDE